MRAVLGRAEALDRPLSPRAAGQDLRAAEKTLRDASSRATKAFDPPLSTCDLIFSGVFELHPRAGQPTGLRGETHRLAHHIGELLANHDRRGVGVAGDHGRHDRGVGDPQRLDPMNPEFGVNHRHRVGPHLASARRVIYCPRRRA